MRGITLIETLVYLAVFALLLTSAVAVGINLATTAATSDVALTDEDDAAFIRAKLAAALDAGIPLDDIDPGKWAPGKTVSFHTLRPGSAIEIDGTVGTASFSIYRSGI